MNMHNISYKMVKCNKDKCEWKMKSRGTVTLKYQKLYPTNLETCLQSISLDRKKVWKSSLQPTYKPHVHQIPLIICVCTNTDIAPTDSQICDQLNQSINSINQPTQSINQPTQSFNQLNQSTNSINQSINSRLVKQLAIVTWISCFYNLCNRKWDCFFQQPSYIQYNISPTHGTVILQELIWHYSITETPRTVHITFVALSYCSYIIYISYHIYIYICHIILTHWYISCDTVKLQEPTYI